MVLATTIEKTTSPQFAGCINQATFKSIAHTDSYGLLSKQEDNLSCMELCGNKKFLYSYFHHRTSDCYCSKTTELNNPDQIENGCDSTGSCNPCQAVVTYLQSPLSFTSCYTHLLGKPFLTLNDGDINLDKCLSICSTDIYDTEVVGFESKFNPKSRKLEWICDCYSGKGNGVSKKKYRSMCGKGGVWRFEVPRN